MTAPKIRKFKHTFDGSATLNSAPQQSSEIQTSLLQVGMRVRKALSQGYRTQWATEEQKFQFNGLRYKKQDTTITLWEEQSQAENRSTGICPSSQESIASTDSSLLAAVSNQHPVLQLRMKRGYVHEEENARDETRMDAISTHLRPIAQAISRRRFVNSRPSKVFDRTLKEADFEDAIFLDPKNQDQFEGNTFEELT